MSLIFELWISLNSIKFAWIHKPITVLGISGQTAKYLRMKANPWVKSTSRIQKSLYNNCAIWLRIIKYPIKAYYSYSRTWISRTEAIWFSNQYTELWHRLAISKIEMNNPLSQLSPSTDANFQTNPMRCPVDRSFSACLASHCKMAQSFTEKWHTNRFCASRTRLTFLGSRREGEEGKEGMREEREREKVEWAEGGKRTTNIEFDKWPQCVA